MPAVPRGDEQSVDIRAHGQELADIAIHLAVLVAVAAERLQCLRGALTREDDNSDLRRAILARVL